MKVRYQSWSGKGRVCDLDDAVRAEITNAHADGQIERLTEQVENAANMLGRLLTMLEDRRLLRDGEILRVLGGSYEVVEGEA